MDSAEGNECETESIVSRMLMINFAASHTTVVAFTHLLYDIAAYPSYIGPLRQEIETLITSEGWQAKTIRKMYKLDSFLRESLRYHSGACNFQIF